MYRKEVNQQSPLRILEASIHGGLGKGNLGVVMARAGAGKTACLVQIGLDDLMRGRKVLHIALGGQSIGHVQSWYDALFNDLAVLTKLVDREVVRASVAAARMILAEPAATIDPEQLAKTLAMYSQALDFAPETLLVDGLDWSGSVATTAATLAALKAIARQTGAELWISAQTYREEEPPKPGCLPSPCRLYEELIDVALALRPEANHVALQLAKDHESTEIKDTSLALQCDTMRIVRSADDQAVCFPASACTLLSGAAQGAEEVFGACAQRWGVRELNFTFEGKRVARTRGLVVLDETDLQEGAVTTQYIEARMQRRYPDSPLFRRILQSIWHQVNTAREVFVIGSILEDGTVKGGTGWAAELAKHLGKRVFVFDQEPGQWRLWTDRRWEDCAPPSICGRRFAGTGTRALNDTGRRAIKELFERSFANKGNTATRC